MGFWGFLLGLGDNTVGSYGAGGAIQWGIKGSGGVLRGLGVLYGVGRGAMGLGGVQ